jgi:DNA-binding MarR family transcriptional regulator
MTASNGGAQKDVQSLSDVDTYVYESIATLEYTGRPATRGQIAAVTDLDDPALTESLASLTDRGLLVRSDGQDGDDAFEPAERGWSTAPDQGRGM